MTDSTSYVELHARSAFSFLEGASLPEALVERATQIDMPAIALLDRNGLYGAARFHTIAKKKGLRAHIGAEISLEEFNDHLPSATRKHPVFTPEPARLPLLCASRQGYQNLCQLLTKIKLRETSKSEGAAVLDEVGEYAEGLVCLTGGEEGILAAAIARGGEAEGRKTVERLTRIFGQQQVYLELQRHGHRHQEWRNQCVTRIANTLHLPIVATNGVRYATSYERDVMDVFTCISQQKFTALEVAGKLLQRNAYRHLRSAKEMSELFADLPGAIVTSIEVSNRLVFELDDLGYEFPQYEIPKGETMDTFLRKRVAEGVLLRYGTRRSELRSNAKKQIERELELVARLGFAGYFLIVWDIVRFCRHKDILVQGRGSAANSAVCYVLQITAVDPVRMDLLFERFLSENRGEWPDIDLDLPSGEKREQAIQYIYERYGELGAAMCANVITYRGRSAAREVGKALGFTNDTIDQLSGLVGHWEWKGPTDTMQHHFSQAGFDLKHPRIAKYLELTLRLQDLPRHLGQHSGGMVICQHQLSKVVPLERASMPGRTVVQWDKEDCADMKIIKVDLLGLGMMAVLKDCVDLIPVHYGETVDLAKLPEDEEVYATLQKADTVGMFQVESRAQMASLPRNKPKEFYDIVVQVAIIRPGPIVGKMMHPYMRRRQGREEVSYPHPMLEQVLRRTLGVPLFQEQLLRIAMIAAGFSGAEAEELRRAVGMRRSMVRMRELEVKLRAGMTVNEISPETQDGIVKSISSFALYGFPESHAASFALIVYASAFLKVNYLAAFTCAMLNNQPMGFYMPAVVVSDAQRHGLRVRPIDISCSEWNCTLEHEASDEITLRVGLRYVKGLRQQAGEAMVQARKADGAFTSAENLVKRVPVLGRRELTQLARVGALNSTGQIKHRRDALWQVEKAGRPVGPLLQNSDLTEEESPLDPMSIEDRLISDYATTGLTVGRHPMSYRRGSLSRERILSARELSSEPDGTWVRTAGCVIARQRPGTASGFVFLSMEDETGIGNVIVEPKLFEQERRLVSHGKFLLVEGLLQNKDSVVHIKAKAIYPLAVANIESRSHNFH